MRAVASWLDTIGQVFQAIPDLATPVAPWVTTPA